MPPAPPSPAFLGANVVGEATQAQRKKSKQHCHFSCLMQLVFLTGVVSSQWFGNDEAGGETHEFILSKDERLTSIDVRAGLWVDAIRLNSSHKSSGWIGGKGGDLYNLSFGDGRGFDDIFGTAGREHVTSIGITRVG